MVVTYEMAPNKIVFGERNFEEATTLLLAGAKQELKIFDPDLSRGGYQSKKVYDLLHAFLVNGGLKGITIVLHDEKYLFSHCPRLITLMQRYSRVMNVYLTNEWAKVAQDAFVLVDDAAYLHRFHIDHPRFKYVLDDMSAAKPLHERFEQLLAATSLKLSADKVGL